MGAPVGVDVGAVLEEEVRHVEVTVDDGKGERRIENLLRCGRVPLEVSARAGVVVRIVVVEIAQGGGARLVEPALHPRQVAHACRMRQIVGQRPDAGEYWNEVCPRVGECELDGLRLGRWLTPQERGIEVEKGDYEVPAVVQRGRCDEPSLKLDAGFTKQPRLTLQPADERRQIAIVLRAPDLPHDKRLPRSGLVCVQSMFDEGLDEGEAALDKARARVEASIDLLAEFSIERDRSLQQE
jgi:hypothetical protein